MAGGRQSGPNPWVCNKAGEDSQPLKTPDFLLTAMWAHGGHHTLACVIVHALTRQSRHGVRDG